MVSINDNSEDIFSSSNRKLFDTLNIPVALADSSKKLTWSSTRFKTLIEGDVTGKDIGEIFNFNPGDLSEGRLYTDENLFWEVRILPAGSTGSDGFVVFLQEKIQASDKIKKRISSIKNFAHDLNNILTSIANSSSLLSGSECTDEKSKKLLANIENNSRCASDIIQQVLNDSSASQSVKRKVNLEKLLNELHGSLINIIRKEITVNFEIGSDLAAITANYSDIYRVLLNLCINASEAIRRKGNIHVNASNIGSKDLPQGVKPLNDTYVKISVIDNGSGIKKKNLEKIFNKNFSTKQRERESGFGLNIARSIIKEHSGHITVKSRRLFGTEFTIYLPAREMFKKSELSADKDKTILLADDEQSILELLTDLLESYSYKVIKAENGNEVLKAYKKEPDIDLMIIDRKMPEMDGDDCIIKLRELNYTNPIILTSGSGSISAGSKVGNLPVEKVMTKPYDFVELLEEVKVLIS